MQRSHSTRLPIERNNWLRSSLLHVPISILLSVFLTALGHIALWLYWSYPVGKPFSFAYLTRFVVANFSEGIGIYLLIALTFYAYSYYSRYREGQLKTLQLEAQLSHAQLQALKMQLHPHFLFNTLNSISVLMSEDVVAARRMLTRMSELLRTSLENVGKHEVSLREELDFLENYLEIEQTRFEDRLAVRMKIEPGVLDARVPNLILQPLVENAIRHGIAPRAQHGLIEISAVREDGMVRLRVRDNGPGLGSIAPENLTPGIGLSNTQARLKQLYGAGHSFEIKDAAGGGLEVAIVIPFRNGFAATDKL